MVNRSFLRDRLVATDMKTFVECNHEAAVGLSWPCPRCDFDVYEAIAAVQMQNVFLRRFVAELYRYGHENIELLKGACLGLSYGLSESMDVEECYIDRIHNRNSEEAKEYSLKYGHFDSEGKLLDRSGQPFAVNAY